MHQALEELCPESKDNHIRSLFRKVAILEAEGRLNAMQGANSNIPNGPATLSEETEEVGDRDIEMDD